MGSPIPKKCSKATVSGHANPLGGVGKLGSAVAGSLSSAFNTVAKKSWSGKRKK